MVTDALLAVVVSLVSWVVTAIPFPAPPDWFTISESGLAYITTWLEVVAAWLPLTLGGLILAAYLAIHALAVLVKLGRQVLSYLTLGGGAT